jgi:hypothetical protein
VNGLATYGFRYARRGEQTILIGEMPEERLDRLDFAMLRAQRVPGLLPVDMRMTDRTAETTYAVGRRKPLTEWLRSQDPLAEERCLQFILHVANLCTQLRDHLLVENRSLIDPQLIYIQEQLLDAEFVYWPDREMTWDEGRMARDIQQLCLFLTRSGSGRGIAGEIMRWCEDPMFTIDGLRKKLISWIDRYEARAEETQPGRTPSPDRGRRWFERWFSFGGRGREEPAVRHEEEPFTVPVGQQAEFEEEATLEYLEQLGAGQETKRCGITRTPFIIGRDRKIADLAFDNSALSRIHAEIKRTGCGYVIRDLGSSNGTRLNGEALPPFTDIPLSSGDRIDIADIRLCFVLDQSQPVV